MFVEKDYCQRCTLDLQVSTTRVRLAYQAAGKMWRVARSPFVVFELSTRQASYLLVDARVVDPQVKLARLAPHPLGQLLNRVADLGWRRPHPCVGGKGLLQTAWRKTSEESARKFNRVQRENHVGMKRANLAAHGPW